MFHVVLVAPEIPPNTGNIIRLCANAGCRLHLVHPLGFELDDARLRRAGLDYHEYTDVEVHDTFDAWHQRHGADRAFAFSVRGRQRHDRITFEPGDALVFGCETRGLAEEHLERFPETCRVRLPMRPSVRSINLSNSVAIAVYEAWRQHDFISGTPPPQE